MGEGQSGVLIPRTQRMLPLLVALGLGLVGVDTPLNVRPAIAKATSKVALKVRRYPGRVDVVVSGVGPTARVVSQRTTSSLWTGSFRVWSRRLSWSNPSGFRCLMSACRPFASHRPEAAMNSRCGQAQTAVWTPQRSPRMGRV